MLTENGVVLLTYGGLKAWDATGKTLSAHFEGTAEGLRILVADANAVYPITVDPLVQTPAWTVVGTQANAQLGFSVSTAGDVNGDGYADVIVGAPYFDDGLTDEGAAFVYMGSPNRLDTTPQRTIEGDQAYAYFGRSVATAGDVNGDGYSDVIIGADGYDGPIFSDVGQVYVYYGSTGGLDASTPWSVTGAESGAAFGAAVNTVGDVNADGCADVVVGAYLATSGEAQEIPNTGRVFVYTSTQCSGGNGSLSASPWTWSGEEPEAWFGFAVAPAGDVNGDGYGDLVVGAPRHGMANDNTKESGWASEEDQGKIYVFYSNGAGLNTVPDWTMLGDQAGAQLGYSVGTAGDVDGDGVSDLLAGAPFYTQGENAEGKVFLYQGSSAGLSSTATWTAEGNQGGGHFGQVVHTAGDVNGDGFADILISAPLYDGDLTDEGRVFVYHGSAQGFAASADWSAEGNQLNNGFAQAVSPAGDVNGDGYADIILGSPHYSVGQTTDAGYITVFYGGADALQDTPDWTTDGGKNATLLGQAVSTAGDVNGDGYADLVVGAPEWDNGQTNEGRVLVYYGGPEGWSSSADWTIESNQANAKLGTSVSTAGDVNGDGYSDLIVGAPYFDGVQGRAPTIVDEGRVYVYYGSSNGLSTLPNWTGRSYQAYALFGMSVSSAGDVDGDGYADVIIGAPDFDGSVTDGGAAFVYLGSANGLSASADWTAEGDYINGDFGMAVSTAGDVDRDGYSDVIVGAPTYQGKGAAFVYMGSFSGLETTAAWTTISTQNGAEWGRSVSTVGDVNGDGYSDIVLSAPSFDAGEIDEGRVLVYYGGETLDTTEDWTLDSDQAGAKLGYSLGAPGDVNGDGFADLVVGAHQFDGEKANDDDGKVWVFYGSATGLDEIAAWTRLGDQDQSMFGRAVSFGGDANGDGYADLAVGAYKYDSGLLADAGQVTVYYGNGGLGVSLLPRQMKLYLTPTVSTRLLAPLGLLLYEEPAGGDVEFRLLGHTPFGCGRVRLEWEVQSLGVPFNGTDVYSQTNWTDTCDSPLELAQELEDLVDEYTTHHWRLRVAYHPTDFPFQQHSRWVTNPWNGWNEADFRTNETTAPSTTHTFVGTEGLDPTWFVSDVEITLTATDQMPGSGIASVEYLFDGCNENGFDTEYANPTWLPYTGPFVYFLEGSHYLCYRAVDRAGNLETPPKFTALRIDQRPPETGVEVSGVDANGWTRFDPAIVSLDATDDDGSGVYRVEYRVTNNGTVGNWEEVIGSEIDLSVSGDGDHVVEFRAQDHAGNWETVQNATFNIDATAPLVLGQAPAPFAVVDDNTPTISIELDNTAGIGSTMDVTMYLDGLAVPYTVTPVSPGGSSPEIFEYIPADELADGVHTVFVVALDSLGNRRESVWQFTVDSYTTLSFEAPFDGTVVNQDTVTLTLATEPGELITVTLSDTTPDGWGTSRTYTTTKGILLVPAWPLNVDANTLEAIATDSAGNTATTALSLTYTSGVHTAQVYAFPKVFVPLPEKYSGTLPEPRPLVLVAHAASAGSNWNLTGWKIRILDEETVVRTLTHENTKLLPVVTPAGVTWTTLWNGKDDAGIPVPNRDYTYILEVEFTLGISGISQIVASLPGTLTVDGQAPTQPTIDSIAADAGGTVWFRHAVAVWGTAPADAEWINLYYVTSPLAAEELVHIQVRVSPNGKWITNLPLEQGQVVEVFATAVDAAGNESGASASLHVGLSSEQIFMPPYAELSSMTIGLDTEVVMTATVRAEGAALQGVWAAVPLETMPQALQTNHTVTISDTKQYTGTWQTPASGTYQGVAVLVFYSQDTALPPDYDERLLTPYLDLKPPWISIHHPVNGQIQGGTVLTVTGVAEPYSIIAVEALPITGQLPGGGETPAPVLEGTTTSDGTGYWQVTLYPYNGGKFLVSAQATDRAGNVGPVDTAEVTVDPSGPSVVSFLATPTYLNPQSPYSTVELSAFIVDNLTGVVSATAVIHNLQDIGETEEGQFTRNVNNPNLFELLVHVHEDAAEGEKQVTISAWDWIANLTQVDVLGFIVDRTPPRVLDVTLNASGSNLYIPTANPTTVYHGPQTQNATLTVVTDVDDTHPVDSNIVVSGLDFLTFPNIFVTGDGGTPSQNGTVHPVVTYPYTVAGNNHLGSNPLIVTLTATDRAGNLSQQTDSFTVAYDNKAPNFSNFLLDITNASHVYKVGSDLLYYGPQSSGPLVVTVNAADDDSGPQAGMRNVRFPGLFGESDTSVQGSGGVYGRTYTVNGTATTNGTVNLTAYDRVGNAKTSPFQILKDATAPTILLTVTQATDDFAVSWAIADPDLEGGIPGSGLATYTIQVCLDSPTACDPLIPNPSPSGSFLYEGQPEHTYTFRVTATDRVDNPTTEEQTFSTASVTKYYLFGGQRVAMRVGTGLQSAVYYLHGDHLGSVSMSTDTSGNIISQARFTPFGEELTWAGNEDQSPTDFGFTGQRNDGYIKLLDYGARWYDARLGRFISADSIIPGAGNPMAFDRYAYVLGNPLRYVDPSGHLSCDSAHVVEGDCTNLTVKQQIALFGVRLSGDWSPEHTFAVLSALNDVGEKFGEILGMTASAAFRAVFDTPNRNLILTWTDDAGCKECKGAGGYTYGKVNGGANYSIKFVSMSEGRHDSWLRARNNVTHELGHLFNARAIEILGKENTPYNALYSTQVHDPSFPNRNGGIDYFGFRDRSDIRTWQQSTETTEGEEFADMMVGWVKDTWQNNPDGTLHADGQARARWMSKMMPLWVNAIAHP